MIETGAKERGEKASDAEIRHVCATVIYQERLMPSLAHTTVRDAIAELGTIKNRRLSLYLSIAAPSPKSGS